MSHVLAKASANLPHMERTGIASWLNYFEMLYEDLILNLRTTSVQSLWLASRVLQWEEQQPVPYAFMHNKVLLLRYHISTVGKTGFPQVDSSPGSLLTGSANFSCSCPTTTNHLPSVPPPLRCFNNAEWWGPTEKKKGKGQGYRSVLMVWTCTFGEKGKV